MDKRLNKRQEIFVNEYALCRNGAEAARRAGYSEKSAKRQAVQILEQPHVQAALAIKEKEYKTKFDITEKQVMDELRSIGFGNLANLAEWSDTDVKIKDSKDLSPADQKYVESVKKTTKRYGVGENQTEVIEVELKTLAGHKVKALNQIGKIIGMENDDADDEDHNSTSITLNYNFSETAGEKK